MKQNSLYEKDFYKWVKTQSLLLKNKNFQNLDLENIIEEIETLGRSDKRALKSQFIVLLKHLLKKKFQPSKSTKSWEKSILNARSKIELILEDSPSLKNEIPEFMDYVYKHARKEASLETGLNENKFPNECPWNVKEILGK